MRVLFMRDNKMKKRFLAITIALLSICLLAACQESPPPQTQAPNTAPSPQTQNEPSTSETENEAGNTIDAPLNSSDILIENSYINFAWGFVYYGQVICVDGSIYSFDASAKGESDHTFTELSEFILEYAVLEEERVSEEDLQKIREYSSGIDPNQQSKPESTAFDAGSNRILLYDYENKKEITLIESGDYESRNTSKDADKLIKIVEKYTKRIR
jgi:gamma-glutamylcyclotransferase (GGCT)/AIG2-like uncharacterized protein YtfP